MRRGKIAKRNHFKYKKPKLENNLARQWADYLEDGIYYREVLELIPTDKIDYDLWNQKRYDDLMEVVDRVPIDPVRLSKKPNGRYDVSDGNHRTAVSDDLGYKYVPAIITQVVEGEKPSEEPPDSLRMELNEREALGLSHRLRSELWKSKVNSFWEETDDDGYVFGISFWDIFGEMENHYLKIEMDGDKRLVSFDYNGKGYRKRFDKDNLEKLPVDFRRWIERNIL